MHDHDVTGLILIPTALTCWDKENRLVGNADLPVCPESMDQVKRWAEQLKEAGVNILFSTVSGPSEETARIIAGVLRVRHRTERDLSEMNMGLWQGMVPADIKQRHPKVYKQWQEQPESVTPPEGERLGAARERIEECIQKILKKHPGQKVGIVLGPVALALARVGREGRALSDLWELVKEPLTWHEYVIKSNGNGNGQTNSQMEGAVRG